MCVFVDAHKHVNLCVHVCEDMLWYENVDSLVCLYVKVHLRVRMCVLAHENSLCRETSWVSSTRHSWHLLQIFFVFLSLFFNGLYRGDIGSQNHTGFKCTAQRNLVCTLHGAPITPNKASVPASPPAPLHLPPHPPPLWPSPHCCPGLCVLYIHTGCCFSCLIPSYDRSF